MELFHYLILNQKSMFLEYPVFSGTVWIRIIRYLIFFFHLSFAIFNIQIFLVT